MAGHLWRYAIAAVAAIAMVGGGIAAVRSAAPGAGTEPAEQAERSPVPVVVPGRPGESATVVPSDEIEAPDGSVYNARDVWFVRMMIPHHAQALEMVALVPDRASRPQVHAIADRIAAAQEPEIAVFESWLAARGLDEPADHDTHHDHGDMPGMQSPAALQRLAGATGDAFDRLFVEMMADHHQGAVDMATELLRAGLDERLQELASAIAVEQAIEITRMRELIDQ